MFSITLLWILIFFILYTYFIYPFLLLFISYFFKKKKYDPQYNLKIDFLIAAYNEEKVIKWKIENTIGALEHFKYSKIWIVSDGSSDKTVEIIKSNYSNNKQIKLIELDRSGKSQAINKALKKLEGDIVIFSDANTMYKPETVEKLTAPFSDYKIGCTCGKLIYQNPDNIVSGKGESFYWIYENTLKKLESKIGYVSGATGAVYAIRRKLYENLPMNCINDDFTISMKIVEKNYKCIYVEEAIVHEDVAPSVESEFKRHVRDATGHYISVFHLFKMLNLFKGFSSFIFWSHRIIRWSVPFMLILIFLINFKFSDLSFYQELFFLQCLFYFLATIGLLTYRLKKVPFIIFVPFYFCNLNLALFFGFLNALFFKQSGKWESTERS